MHQFIVFKYKRLKLFKYEPIHGNDFIAWHHISIPYVLKFSSGTKSPQQTTVYIR